RRARGIRASGPQSARAAAPWVRASSPRSSPRGAPVPQSKIRIRLKGYDHQALDRSAASIAQTATRPGAPLTGPLPLPAEGNIYTGIRGPFKDKGSREHFEIRTHKRLIDILQPTPKTVDSLQRLDHLPAGVDIQIQLILRHGGAAREKNG